MSSSKARVRSTIRVVAMAIGVAATTTYTAVGQTTASDGDKHFLEEISQESNYEIKTSQLALQKSKSADIRQYATMVLHDHTALKQQISLADTAA